MTEPLFLPDPREKPGTDVVIYDGQCKFCTAQVARLHRWDRKGKLTFISLHDPWVQEQYPELTHDMLMEEMYLVTSEGKRFAGAAAFRYLTRKLPILWILAPVMHIPFSLPVWQWGYRQVARQRYRWGKIEGNGCDGGTCHVHFK